MSIKIKLTRAVATSVFKLKKNSPHILFASGVAGVVTGTVLACRATLKANAELDDIKAEIDTVKASEPESRELAYVYGKSAGRMVRVYGPAIAVTGAGLALLTGSHVQLTRRNTALTIAYATLHQAYMEYRDRVREHVGEEKEKDLYFGTALEKVKGENNKLTDIKSIDPNKLSPYARFFDEGSPNWHKDPEHNLIFIKCQQEFANQRLRAYGFVFLNDVYESLGIDRTQAGQVVGWMINNDGDNYIDFGLYDAHNSSFVNGHEPSILLDFNVDGVIFDKI